VPEGEWEIVCTSEQFEDFRHRDEFKALLTLARVSNALRFFQLTYPLTDEDTPSIRRQRINCFLFMASALYEALSYASTLGRYFEEHPTFRETFGTLLGSDEVRGLRTGILRHLRNKVTFHFEEELLGKALEELDLAHLRFVTGTGRRAGDTYFDMADEVASHAVLLADDEEVYPFSELEELMRKTVRISGEFLGCADQLITDELRRMGWTARERANGA
jgi:hypothetical protein